MYGPKRALPMAGLLLLIPSIALADTLDRGDTAWMLASAPTKPLRTGIGDALFAAPLFVSSGYTL